MDLSLSAAAVQSSLARFQDAAVRVSAGPQQDDFVAGVVDMKVAQRDLEAAVQVLKRQNEVLGYLLNELA